MHRPAPALLLKVLILLSILLSSHLVCGTDAPSEAPPKYEFRAVWIATFHNIDWPSAKGLSPAAQQEEFRALLDRQQANGMNAAVVQVRPCGDALYPSSYEPWSEYLSGTQGEAPTPYYDPLAFMIEEAHSRNMEFHAWINPFRAISHVRFSSVSEDHLWHQKPEWFFQYGDSRYFNPGIPEVRAHISKIIMEIVSKYDVDGVHFDDYFYPYPQPNLPFHADKATFRTYGAAYPTINAWRRHNIDAFIELVSDSMHAVKPHIKLGISPAPVWRNKHQDPAGSETHLGYSTYDHLHADVRKWLQESWVDYVAPQCYYSVDFSSAPYKNLLSWWADNTYGRHLYIGHAMYKAKEAKYKAWQREDQIPRQLALNRDFDAVRGSIFYSAGSFEGNPHHLEEKLRFDLFRRPALVPPMAWKDTVVPLPPQHLCAMISQQSVHLQWQAPELAADGEGATYYVVYRFVPGELIDLTSSVHIQAIQRTPDFEDLRIAPGSRYIYVITSVDRQHNESKTYRQMEVDIPGELVLTNLTE